MEASNSAGCSVSKPVDSPEITLIGSVEPFPTGRRPASSAKELGKAAGGLPGVLEDDMLRRNDQRKLGSTRGSPRRTCTAKASRISRSTVKSRCACEWGGWGRLSDDGPGQNNPDRSEGPWGRAIVARTAVYPRVYLPVTERTDDVRPRDARRMDANWLMGRVCRVQA
jgi:hypothetical protein